MASSSTAQHDPSTQEHREQLINAWEDTCATSNRPPQSATQDDPCAAAEARASRSTWGSIRHSTQAPNAASTASNAGHQVEATPLEREKGTKGLDICDGLPWLRAPYQRPRAVSGATAAGGRGSGTRTLEECRRSGSCENASCQSERHLAGVCTAGTTSPSINRVGDKKVPPPPPLLSCRRVAMARRSRRDSCTCREEAVRGQRRRRSTFRTKRPPEAGVETCQLG